MTQMAPSGHTETNLLFVRFRGQSVLGMTLRAVDQGFVYNDDTGEAFLNGKQCTGVPKEIRGIKIHKGQGANWNAHPFAIP